MLKKLLVLLGLATASAATHSGTKPTLDIAVNYAAINETANLFIDSFGPNFTSTPRGHIQTDIAGAGAMAGLVLLRNTVPDLDSMSPGTVVISDVHDGQKELLGFMGRVAGNMGLDGNSGWADPVPSADQPMIDTLELTRRLEVPFRRACEQTKLPKEYHAHAAALTAMKLVSAGEKMQLLDQKTGKALAFYYLVAGSKTVPQPIGR